MGEKGAGGGYEKDTKKRDESKRDNEEEVGRGRWVLIVEMEERRDKEELLEKGEEIGRLWRIGVDENLSMEKRKRRWRMVETAGRERAMRKRVEVSNRELRVEGRR